ncbi:MAG TPA: hypothetical protein VJ875_24505 [Pyrinomonadaceae bacterium]|nr:hypothetical protein [Pyrinomonadaceae bacterium]
MKYRFLIPSLLIALCALSVQAQSGRRQTKPAPAAPVPTPTPEATPIPKKPEKQLELSFFVGVNRNEASYSLPFTYYDAVMRGCAERLRSGSSVSVDTTDRDFGRGDAIKKAKSETRTYVVLLTLTFDSMARSYDDLILDFVLFEPVTSKVITTGRSYQQATRKGPIVVGPPSGGAVGGLYREQLLKQAGEDAADRILKRLHLNVEVPK